MTIYAFDLDGTLTPPRLPMTQEFAQSFLPWLKNNKAFIATGSDINKVKEQLSPEVIKAFAGIYCSMGNDLWKDGDYLYRHDFTPEPELLKDLKTLRQNTKYPFQLFDNFIEKRTGMLNFSILGRNCPYAERERYYAWDNQHHERENTQIILSKKYPQYDFVLGGTISMDIIKKGCGKGQIAHHLRQSFPQEKIIFFGDKTFPGGNDYELAHTLQEMKNTQVIQVDTPQEVLDTLL